MKLRKLLLAAALGTSSVFAQQNVDISGKDFNSGAGDAKFAMLGRQAAASGKRIVVTAPQEWHGKIAAKIRAGGAADIVLKDGFYENVLVRVEEKPAEPKPEPPKAEPRQEPKAAAPRPAPERVPVEVPGPKPTPPPPVVQTPPPAPVQPAPAPAPAPVAAPVKPPAPVTAAPATASQAAASTKADIAKIQKRFEQSLNNGREAEGPLSVPNLQGGDFIYVDGPVRAVVRRESLRPRLFWLEGELDLRRTELKELGPNRYQLIDPIRGENYSLRDQKSEQSQQLTATEPADNAPTRATFERDYNEGRPIGNTIAVAKLRAGDIVYTGKGVAVVVRREGPSLARYWLDGSLDLGQPGLQKDGANKYKVMSDTLR